MRRLVSNSLAVGLLLFVGGASASWGACPGNTGASGVPKDFWGQLQPTDVGLVPDARDTTEYTGGSDPTDYRHPLFSSIDVEGGYAFTSYSFGFHIWNLNGQFAEDPQLSATKDQGRGDFLDNIGYQEKRWLMWDVDAPSGNPNVVATSGVEPFGLAVWDTSDKQNPVIRYQDTGRAAHQVFATTIGNRVYAFTASSGPGADDKGLLMYDMTSALSPNGKPCQEDSSASTSCGVFQQRLGPTDGLNYVDGFKTSTGRTIVVASGGPGDSFQLGVSGVVMWDVSNPAAPVDLLNGQRLLSSDYVAGLAAWQQGGRNYLAVQPYGKDARILDIGGCLSGGCTNPPVVWTSSWPATDDAGAPFKQYVRWVTYSKGGDGTPYLYFGTESLCVDVVQGEWLFDLSNLATTGPEEITPTPTQLIGGKKVGYWSYYYPTRPTGFNRLVPRVGKVYGNYFYRAAWTLFDVHQIVNLSPKVTVTGPTSGYAGSPVSFTASASTCTPDPTGWSWSATGTTVSDTDANATIIFPAPGTKTVSATNTGCPGATVVSATIQVLDPAPAIDSVTATPSTAPQCTPITLAATATGQPTLSYGWNVDTVPATTGAGSTFVWDTSGVSLTTAQSTFSATVTVTNTAGSAQQSVPVTITQLQPLPTAGFTSLSNDPFVSATVHFHVDEPGATSWNWDFGTGYVGWVSDPLSGPNPVHSYTQAEVDAACSGVFPCTFQVKVKVRNCLSDPAGVESAALPVEVQQLTPLHAEFAAQASCQVAPCVPSFTAGQAITFLDSSTGAELYDYDWDGNGQFEDPGHASPVTSHTYPSAGTFSPKLRVRRGISESDTFTHQAITINPSQPASITISGPSSGSVGQSLTFSAFATGCTPSATGWSWGATGTRVADTDSAASIAFSSAGAKTVSVTNSSCGTTQGVKSVSITDSGGGNPPPPPTGGGIQAAFTYSPNSPQAGQAVSFDASATTGDVSLAYSWSFGDSSSGNGKQTSHVFETGGQYAVTLSVSEKGCLSPDCPSDSEVKTVTVTGGAPAFAATFDTSAECINEFGFNQCQAQTGQTVSFTGTTKGATQHQWSFGDGETATGKQVTHTWTEPGNFTLRYTASDADDSDTVSRTFVISGEPQAENHTVVLPWIAQADPDKALQQESDLYVYNPGPGSLTVEITFRKQGLPEPDPPHVSRTLQENQTLYLGDVMTELFDRPNIKGFLIVEPKDGDAQPIVTSFNRTHDGDRLYGQVITGVELTNGTSARAAGTDSLHLVGLNDTDQRLGYFGITNPTDHRLDYQLQLFDSIGRPIGSTVEPSAVAAFSQKQYQVEEIRQQFGVDAVQDYRVTVKPAEGSGLPIPFGANLRLGSKDPSFVRAGRTDTSKVFIVGVLDSGGLNGSQFQSDLVLSNTANDLVNYRMTFIGVGPFTEPSATIQDSLPAGETTRLGNVVSEWNTDSSLGVIEVESDSPDGIYPIVQGESYDISDPSRVYGQFMPALTLADAAQPGTPRSLVGLQQDADFINGTRSTVWLFNPEDSSATYTLRYLALDGTELGAEEATLGGQKLRQVNPGFHPLPAGGAPQGFVVRVEVSKGKLLVSGQVVNEFNDPAYLVGR